MRPDPSRTGETPVDYGPGFTQREELDILWMTDPRRDWPSRAELLDEMDPRGNLSLDNVEWER